MLKKNPALLPSGFVDLLPPDAEREANAIGMLMETFAAFGYQRVKPPLLEFEDSLFAPGLGAAMQDRTFRVMDPLSHRMMGLRSDVTGQIVRILRTRLGKEPRPVRVCYVNDALRTQPDQRRVERQFTQVGCEIMGGDALEADIESCVAAVIGLHEIGVTYVTIDLAYPGIVGALFEQYKISASDVEKIKAALEQRNPGALKGIDKKLASMLDKLMHASGPAEKALAKLSALSLSPAIKVKIKELSRLYEGVRRAVNELKLGAKITIDPVENPGFQYYSGPGFALFVPGVSGELGRGGRYTINADKKASESACGFTLYMDAVIKVLPPVKKKNISRAGYDENWSDIRAQQRKGAIVIRGKK